MAGLASGRGDKSTYEEWLRITTTAAVETELNLQIGTFTLKSNQVIPLPACAHGPSACILLRGIPISLSIARRRKPLLLPLFSALACRRSCYLQSLGSFPTSPRFSTRMLVSSVPRSR